jgi:hypothetical protein
VLLNDLTTDPAAEVFRRRGQQSRRDFLSLFPVEDRLTGITVALASPWYR